MNQIADVSAMPQQIRVLPSIRAFSRSRWDHKSGAVLISL